MRTLLIATAAMAIATTGTASAQRVVTRGPGMQRPYPGPIAQGGIRPVGPGVRPPVSRWGTSVGGRWPGAVYAPGGLSAYRRPVRGFVLPGYWVSPNFLVGNWSAYNLAQPPVGYGWSRYYDDAVLIDSRGSVYDSVSDVDWDRGYDDRGYDYRSYDDAGYDDGVAYEGDYDASYRGERRDTGVGGALIGGVAGGVAGNLIAGRGNRLGGTLIGAGVGAVAGYAVDKAEDRGRLGSRYGAGYAAPGSYAPPPSHGAVVHGRPAYVGNGTTVVTSGGAIGARTGYSGGYHYPSASVTTITVASAPVVTTSVTETYEDVVTYTRPAPRKVYRKTWKPRRKEVCSCR